MGATHSFIIIHKKILFKNKTIVIISVIMFSEELIPGMEKIIQHIKRIQEENTKLKEANRLLQAQVQAQAPVEQKAEALERAEQQRAVVSFD